ncbi:30S ribosomal protein S1 [Candidatus Dependentiae bacterium Noda2021]|nr:30S ribosomal protein S1 [Candidatus Dependentiae bacterium Noda2021]
MSKEFIKPTQFAHADRAVLIDDELLSLNDEQKQEIDSLYQGALENLTSGKLIQGTIMKVTNDGVVVDINFKSEGFIPRYEFSEFELKKLKAGDAIEVILDEIETAEGQVLLSYEKAKALRAWDEITRLYEEGKPVEGTVTHKVKGGLSVDIGIPAFLPGSQIDLQRVIDFDQYVGQPITANVIKINKKRGNVIISRRKFLSEQRAEGRKKILDTLHVGQVIQGIVKNITNYGVFIDIGGVDGLLHITDMTWGRIAHPSEMVRIGDNISVVVLSFDKSNEKISLGLKQLSGNPWEKVSEALKVGDKVKGKISSITDYGLFVEIQKGVEGLVHISEISWTDRINDLASKFKVGQEIEVLIVSLDKENRRMSLSIKQIDRNPWEAVDEQFKVGQHIKGTISNITDFGIFVQLMPGIDGLVHISDLSWTEHIDHPSDIYKKGDTVEAVVLGVDKVNKKISLGIKQLTQDPWENIESEYPAGTLVEGKVSKITNFGAFIKLPTGIEGLVHISELADHNVNKVEDILKVGQSAQFRVININKEERKLGLSLKTKETGSSSSYSSYEQAPRMETERREKPKVARAEKQQHSKNQTTSAPKSKNLFQLELEKYAARQKQDGDETTSSDSDNE